MLVVNLSIFVAIFAADSRRFLASLVLLGLLLVDVPDPVFIFSMSLVS